MNEARSVTQRLADGEANAAFPFPTPPTAVEDGQTVTWTAGKIRVFDGPPPPVNPTGIQPTEYKVLIEPKAVEEKIGSIIVPVSEQEKQKWATTEGTLVAVSPLAFTYASEKEWNAVSAAPPKPGERILYAKYAGVNVKGKDGKEYILANDKDVLAVMTD